MKYILLLLTGLFGLSGFAQDYIEKRVVSEDGVPLPYSTVRLIPLSSGSVANEDGFFVIEGKKFFKADSVEISHLGFQSLTLTPDAIDKTPIVTLTKTVNELEQVNILADSQKRWAEIVFLAFKKRRESNLAQTAKGNFTVRSYLENEPIEVLEGQTAIDLDNTGTPSEIKFAAVQTNIDSTNELQFFSIHTSNLISAFEPFQRSEVSVWPLHPGRLGKRGIMKDFKIGLVNYNHETGISEFELISEEPEYLSARLWLDEEGNTILRYEIFGKEIGKLPIVSIIEDRPIENFSMKITYDFGSESEELNYFLWDYQFNYGSDKEIKTKVKMPLEDGVVQLPVFLRDHDYHDYAMAAILPKSSGKTNDAVERRRSLQDRKALETLQEGATSLNLGLLFWEEEKPLDAKEIPQNENLRKQSFDALATPSRSVSLNDRFRLEFNSVVYPLPNGKFGHRTFLDKVSSAVPDTEDRQAQLLINLMFDEYRYTAARVVSSATETNLNEVLASERKELQLRKDRLLINSKGGVDLSYLLERNFSNYELHGIDRFNQLNNRTFENPLFIRIERHLNPTFKDDLALAHVLMGKSGSALTILNSIGSLNAESLYVKALAYYFEGDCAKFRSTLEKAQEAGYEIPSEAAALCL